MFSCLLSSPYRLKMLKNAPVVELFTEIKNLLGTVVRIVKCYQSPVRTQSAVRQEEDKNCDELISRSPAAARQAAARCHVLHVAGETGHK